MQKLLQSRSNRLWPSACVGRVTPALALVPLAFALSGCAVVEGIFKAGVWVGVIAVAIVLAVAFGLVRLMSS
jgi:hypothetical protein